MRNFLYNKSELGIVSEVVFGMLLKIKDIYIKVFLMGSLWGMWVGQLFR